MLKQLTRAPDGRVCGAQLERRPSGALETISADVIIGADGKASATRKLAGIAGERETIGFTVGLSLPRASVPAKTHGNVILGTVCVQPEHDAVECSDMFKACVIR